MASAAPNTYRMHEIFPSSQLIAEMRGQYTIGGPVMGGTWRSTCSAYGIQPLRCSMLSHRHFPCDVSMIDAFSLRLARTPEGTSRARCNGVLKIWRAVLHTYIKPSYMHLCISNRAPCNHRKMTGACGDHVVLVKCRRLRICAIISYPTQSLSAS